ncbi:hypothetical protein ACFL5F_04265 [Planctomycetota bacterium]
MIGLGRRRQVENDISRQIEKNRFDQMLFGHPACKIDVCPDQALGRKKDLEDLDEE